MMLEGIDAGDIEEVLDQSVRLRPSLADSALFRFRRVQFRMFSLVREGDTFAALEYARPLPLQTS